jgi:hypothetical protein
MIQCDLSGTTLPCIPNRPFGASSGGSKACFLGMRVGDFILLVSPRLTELVMCILVEASQQVDLAKTEQIWELLSELYLANPTLSQLSGDRRPFHAAELIVAAWKARQHKFSTSRSVDPPEFIINLENQLSRSQSDPALGPDAGQKQHVNTRPDLTTAGFEAHPAEQEVDAAFGLDFQDIDCSFWSSID